MLSILFCPLLHFFAGPSGSGKVVPVLQLETKLPVLVETIVRRGRLGIFFATREDGLRFFFLPPHSGPPTIEDVDRNNSYGSNIYPNNNGERCSVFYGPSLLARTRLQGGRWEIDPTKTTPNYLSTASSFLSHDGKLFLITQPVSANHLVLWNPQTGKSTTIYKNAQDGSPSDFFIHKENRGIRVYVKPKNTADHYLAIDLENVKDLDRIDFPPGLANHLFKLSMLGENRFFFGTGLYVETSELFHLSKFEVTGFSALAVGSEHLLFWVDSLNQKKSWWSYIPGHQLFTWDLSSNWWNNTLHLARIKDGHILKHDLYPVDNFYVGSVKAFLLNGKPMCLFSGIPSVGKQTKGKKWGLYLWTPGS